VEVALDEAEPGVVAVVDELERQGHRLLETPVSAKRIRQRRARLRDDVGIAGGPGKRERLAKALDAAAQVS
jgi:hypothetical protein